MVKITFYGHSFFRIDFKENSVLIDPYIGSKGSVERIQGCTAKPADLKGISTIFITNEHFDHLDKEAVQEIASKNNAVVVAHDSILSELDIPGIQKYAIRESKEFSLKGVKVKVMPAHYPQSFYPVGFLLEGDNTLVYHAGDTALQNEVFSGIKPDIALLPIGGQNTMDIVDCVRATKIMKPGTVIPMHYNTFDNIKQDPLEFKEKIDKSILKTDTVILNPGEFYEHKKRR